MTPTDRDALLDRIGERIADEVEKAAAGRQTNCEQAAIDVLSLASPSTDLSLRNPSGVTIRSTMGGATGGHDDDRTVAGSHGPRPLASPSERGLVDFYEREFYPLSNFSAFTLQWYGQRFDTSEAAYHWMKFPPEGAPTPEAYAQRQRLLWEIMEAPSAHEAFKLAERNKAFRRPDWDDVKVDVMRQIIRAKADQHEYVKRKLMETGDRPLIEGSWRDDYWGVGPNGDGQNMLGKLWMELRASYRGGA